MIGDKAANLFIDNTTKRQKNTRARLVLDDGTILITDGLYYLKYRPYRDQYVSIKDNDKEKEIHGLLPFFIKADIFYGHKSRISNMNMIRKRAKTDSKFKYLLEYTNINKDMFKLAVENPGTPIPFCADMVKYRNHIAELSGAKKLPGLFWEEYER